MGPPHEGSIQRPIAPWANALTTELYLAPLIILLIDLKCFDREAYIHNQYLVLMVFYLEKAYDTTWKYGILKDFYGFDLASRLNFLFQFFKR